MSNHLPESLDLNQAVPLADDETRRRFGGVARLYGETAYQAYRRAHVAVIGIGGVGSWTVEALARSGVGRLTLFDLDHVSLGNANRQLHALDGNFGKAKVEAMRERVALINPDCEVAAIDEFVEPDTLNALLGQGFDFIVDAIDDSRAKVALLAWAGRRGQAIVTVGGAGGQIDPTRVKVDDLARTIQDPLLAKVRGRLRREFGYPPAARGRMGIRAVYSDEALRQPPVGDGAASSGRLNCAGFGSGVVVTATFGFVAAAEALNAIARSAASA